MIQKISASMAEADLATQAELDAAIAAEVIARNAAIAAAPKAAGDIVQIVNTQTGAVATTTTPIPNDDSIPQITEGGEFMTLAITPTSATNKLRIDVVCNLATSIANGWPTAALFQGATANAIACGSEFMVTGGGSSLIAFSHFMTAGTTSEITFRVRGGIHAAGTATFNGTGGTRLFGGALASSITITEIKV